MKNTVTFAIISHAGCKIRKITASKQLISTLGVLAAGSLILLLAFIYKYEHAKSSVSDTQSLRAAMVRQRLQINIQNKQIQSFKEELNSLRETLAKLDEFEKKIRIIANVESRDDQTGLFGVGGSASEDTDFESARFSQMADIYEQNKIPKTAPAKQYADFKALLNRLKGKTDLLAATPSILPAEGRITSTFGYHRSPLTRQQAFHRGLDIATPKGTAVVATADGIIAYTGPKGMLGRTIVIDHGHGTVTRYGHLHKILKPVGSEVKRGEIIGRIGTSGRNTDPHLHYEVRINGIPVNPEEYMDMAFARYAAEHKPS